MMTTLQIVLAIVGISLIAVIVIYNLLQERRFRKEAEKMFSLKREDVMLGESLNPETSHSKSESRVQLTDDSASAAETEPALKGGEESEPISSWIRCESRHRVRF
jgi:hypothetical protein